jgi:hypothetical protein
MPVDVRGVGLTASGFYGTSKETVMPHLIDSNIGIVFMESIRGYVQYRPGNNKYTKREEAAKRKLDLAR